MACKPEFKKKCESLGPTKDGNRRVATWNTSKKRCECKTAVEEKDDQGKVISTRYVD